MAGDTVPSPDISTLIQRYRPGRFWFLLFGWRDKVGVLRHLLLFLEALLKNRVLPFLKCVLNSGLLLFEIGLELHSLLCKI